MQTTLKDTLGSAKYHAGCNRMMRDLVNRNLTQTDAHDVTRRVEFAPANSLWVDLGTSVKTPFLNLLAAHYNSGVYGVNFSTQPDASRIAINDWVSGHTHDRIKDLLSQNDVDSSTRIVLVNALYFFANWSDLFFKTATSPATFHTLAGTDVSADTMHKSAHMLYKATDTYQVLNISYVSGDLSMVVVLPNADAFDATRAQISAQWVEDNRNGLTSTNVDLSLPKFSIGTGQMHLKDTLSSMGMQLAFTGSADFSGISTDTRLQISDVIQKAFIGVDESGTEASAATAVMLNGSGPPQTPVDFNVNRPFIYYIQDKTGLVLFAGQVVDPTS
jgi:serpin B